MNAVSQLLFLKQTDSLRPFAYLLLYIQKINRVLFLDSWGIVQDFYVHLNIQKQGNKFFRLY